MVTLDGVQLALLKAVSEEFQKLEEPLGQLQTKFRVTEYNLKRNAIQAIENAREANVPLARILKETGSITYPAALERWMDKPEELETVTVEEGVTLPEGFSMETTAPKEVGSDTETHTVLRNHRTGMLTVLTGGKEYEVLAMGPETDLWAARKEDIPQEVYDLIKETYPSFVVLDDDEDDV